MNYRSLGESDLSVSEFSFGCMSLEPDQNTTNQLLKAAYDNGINFFDTADLYDRGHNEAMVGQALKEIRKDVIIATKVGNEWREDGSGWDWNPRKEYIIQAVEKSLKRLQTDYIDLYQLHGGTIEDPVDETIEAFEILKSEGKIRAYGISSIRPNVIREWVKRSNMSSVMMQYSMLDQRPEEECLDLLHEHTISVITRGSLAKGMLVDKPAKEYICNSKDDVQKLISTVQKHSQPEALALRYVLNHPAVSSAVVGVRTNEHLESIIKAYSTEISKSELRSCTSLLRHCIYENHR